MCERCQCCNKFYNCLASMAILKKRSSRKPMPPLAFALVKISHAAQCVFLSSKVEPQNSRVVAFSISWHVVIGKRKQFIEYIGIACKTGFISTSLPACDNDRSFQSFICCKILSTMHAETSFYSFLLALGGQGNYDAAPPPVLPKYLLVLI